MRPTRHHISKEHSPMNSVLEQVKTAAYTSVGVNLLVSDAVTENVREQADKALRRLGPVGERATVLVASANVPTPDFLVPYFTTARKQATEALVEFRSRVEPRAAELEARLPEPLKAAASNGRHAAWEFLGIDAPKSAAKAATAPKAPVAETATKKATKRVTKKATARKRTARKAPAKKVASV
jgi:hypothetical protein